MLTSRSAVLQLLVAQPTELACDMIVARYHVVEPARLSSTFRLPGDCGKYWTLIVSNVVRSNKAVGGKIDTTVGLGSSFTSKLTMPARSALLKAWFTRNEYIPTAREEGSGNTADVRCEVDFKMFVAQKDVLPPESTELPLESKGSSWSWQPSLTSTWSMFVISTVIAETRRSAPTKADFGV